MYAKRCTAALLTAALAACGGGSGGPAALATAQPHGGGPAFASVPISIVIPSASKSPGAKKPSYVSSSTQSASVTIAPTGSGTGATTLLNCSTTACSGTVNAPVGSDLFTIKLYDAANASGNLLSTGSLTQTIVAGQPNAVNATFDGVVSSLAISLPTVTPGTAGSVAVSVNARDADNNIIVGPGRYVNAQGAPLTIGLTDSDTSGRSSLSRTSITQPGTTVSLNYTASFAANPTITASATGLANASATVVFPSPTLTGFAAVTPGVTSITLTGTNFVSGATQLTSANPNITFSNVVVTSSTSLTASVTVGAVAFGSYAGTVQTPEGSASDTAIGIADSGTVIDVTRADDANPGTPAGTGVGNPGDLRFAILTANANPDSVIRFNCGTPCTIALAAPLPPITANMMIDGGSYTSTIVDGGNATRAFWAETGTVYLANMTIQNVLAKGGNGGVGAHGGGGGGAGLGAGLFVDAASVTLANDYFVNASAVGGNGGAASTADDGGGGGGGLGGNGGGSTGSPDGSGGGGGGSVIASGADATTANGGNGGAAFDASVSSGTAASSTTTPAAPLAAAYGGGGGGGGAFTGASGGTGATGGAGAFGAGGGGGGGAAITSTGVQNGSGLGADGAPGGFGGGGGSGGNGNLGVGGCGGQGAGGNGGPGGGGGAGGGNAAGCLQGSGGVLATLTGGSGSPLNVFGGNGGGGGAAAGPAVFVNTGTLVTINSGAATCSATAGASGGVHATAGTADSTPVFSYAGTINGTSIAGPAASALLSTTPQ